MSKRRPAIRANLHADAAIRRGDSQILPSNMHPALVARDDGPEMQRNVQHTHAGRSERACKTITADMAQTPRRALPEAAGAMQDDALSGERSKKCLARETRDAGAMQ